MALSETTWLFAGGVKLLKGRGELPSAAHCLHEPPGTSPGLAQQQPHGTSSKLVLCRHPQLRTTGWVSMEWGAHLPSTLFHARSTFSRFLSSLQLLN